MNDARSEEPLVGASGQALSARGELSTATTHLPAPRQSAPQRVMDVWRRDAALGAVPAPGGWADRLVVWAQRRPTALVWLAIALSVLMRVFLVFHTHAMIDGDEAMVGIQAEGILRGQFPIYFPDQAYMGSLETYIAAGIFALFGPSNWALRAVPILESPLLVYLTWRLARDLLPRDARTTPLLAGLAALLAAIPPLYDAVTELRAWGGQIEVYVITLALLVATVELANLLRAGAPLGRLALRWSVWGFLAGLGFWINPLISYALLTSALWLAPALVDRAFPGFWLSVWARVGRLRNRKADSDLSKTPTSDKPAGSVSVGVLGVALLAIPGIVVGGLPAWVYALANSGANIMVYLTQPTVSPTVSGAARHGRLFLGAAITARYFTCVGPRVLDGALPPEGFAWFLPRLLILLPVLLAILSAIWLTRSPAPNSYIRAGLPLLYATVITLVFCLGTSAWPATKQCSYDQAGRYAVPLALVEPLFLLALFATPTLCSAIRARFGRPPAPLNQEALRRGWSLVLLVLLLFVGAQAITYPLAAPDTTFQSPFYRYAPMDDSQLLAYLTDHHIHAAWCNHWIGNIVTFQTDGQTTCADYYDQVVRGGLKRPAGTLETVSSAANPSFILALTEAHPILAQELDARHIPYTIAVLKQSGVTVITPAYRVDPATVIPGISEDYGLNAKR